MNIPGLKIIDPNLNIRSGLPQNNPEHIIVHHALAKNCTVWDIHRWHLNNGWAGIGYHFFIDKQGQVYKGRDINQSGAHCPPLNSRSIGICLEGCYQEYKNQTDREVPEAQLAALIKLTQGLMVNLSIPINRVQRHSDYSSKLCPGNYFPWEEFVERVKNVDEGGEEDMKGLIILFSNVDFFTAEELMEQTGHPMITRKAYKGDMTPREVYIVGGEKDYEADRVIHLSGQNRYETAYAVGQYLRG